jgi:flagellar motor switch protein FliN/FliY
MSEEEQDQATTDSAVEATPNGGLEEAIEQATEAVAVQANELEELDAIAPDGADGSDPMSLSNLMDVPVQVTVEVGRTRMTLGELVSVRPGSLVELDREAHEPADILVNGKIVARGEIVTIDDTYGVRVTDVERSK